MKLGLPFTIKYSKIKKLQVKASIFNLGSTPVEINLESLTLIVAPLPRNEWVVNNTWSFDYKKSQIEDFLLLLIEKMRSSEGGSSSSANSSEKSLGFVDKKKTYILDNVQLSIKNIHIRYEGGVWLQDNPFSFGLTLK